jgi:hypothetical protein
MIVKDNDLVALAGQGFSHVAQPPPAVHIGTVVL